MERKGPSSFVFSQTKAALLRSPPPPGLLFRTWHREYRLRLPMEEVVPGTVHTIWGPIVFNECSAVQCLPACCASYTSPGSHSAGCGCAGTPACPASRAALDFLVVRASGPFSNLFPGRLSWFQKQLSNVLGQKKMRCFLYKSKT